MVESPEVPEPSRPPQRELRDPRALRALAHPVRLRILEELLALGQATATELAERLGESPANCSWHLRQLAAHGFIEEAGGGTGRQRPWRTVPQNTMLSSIGSERDEPEFSQARDTLVEVLLGHELAAWQAWFATRDQEPPPWREASFSTQSNSIWLTAEELGDFKKELYALVDRHILPRLNRIEPAERPAGSRPTRFVAWGIPSGPPDRQR